MPTIPPMINRLRCLAVRAWGVVSRRVGRRGALLLSSGWLAIVYGLSLYYPAPPNATATYLASIAPLTVWAALWAATGLLCVTQAVMRHDRIAYSWGACTTLTWAVLMTVAWLTGALPRGWVLASIFLAVASPFLVGAGWHETLRLRPHRPAWDAVDAVVTADAEGLITGWDAQAEHMFGWPAAEIVGRPLTLLMPQRARAAHTDGVARVAVTGRTALAGQTITTTALTRDGQEFGVRILIGLHTGEGAPVICAVIRDLRDAA